MKTTARKVGVCRYKQRIAALESQVRDQETLISSLRAQVQGRDEMMWRIHGCDVVELKAPQDLSTLKSPRTLYILERGEAIPIGAFCHDDVLAIHRKRHLNSWTVRARTLPSLQRIGPTNCRWCTATAELVHSPDCPLRFRMFGETR